VTRRRSVDCRGPGRGHRHRRPRAGLHPGRPPPCGKPERCPDGSAAPGRLRRNRSGAMVRSREPRGGATSRSGSSKTADRVVDLADRRLEHESSWRRRWTWALVTHVATTDGESPSRSTENVQVLADTRTTLRDGRCRDGLGRPDPSAAAHPARGRQRVEPDEVGQGSRCRPEEPGEPRRRSRWGPAGTPVKARARRTTVWAWTARFFPHRPGRRTQSADQPDDEGERLGRADRSRRRIRVDAIEGRHRGDGVALNPPDRCARSPSPIPHEEQDPGEDQDRPRLPA